MGVTHGFVAAKKTTPIFVPYGNKIDYVNVSSLTYCFIMFEYDLYWRFLEEGRSLTGEKRQYKPP